MINWIGAHWTFLAGMGSLLVAGAAFVLNVYYIRLAQKQLVIADLQRDVLAVQRWRYSHDPK